MKSIEDSIIIIATYTHRLGIERDHQSEILRFHLKATGLLLKANQLAGNSMEMIKTENKLSSQQITISQSTQHQVLLTKILVIEQQELIIKKPDNSNSRQLNFIEMDFMIDMRE